jgi:hypothetical protein
MADEICIFLDVGGTLQRQELAGAHARCRSWEGENLGASKTPYRTLRTAPGFYEPRPGLSHGGSNPARRTTHAKPSARRGFRPTMIGVTRAPLVLDQSLILRLPVAVYPAANALDVRL